MAGAGVFDIELNDDSGQVDLNSACSDEEGIEVADSHIEVRLNSFKTAVL